MKRLAAAIAVMAAMALCGCGAPVVGGTGDEVKAERWECETPSGIRSELTFSGDYAKLTVKSGSDYAEISGLCVIDDSRMVILDDTGEYIFAYKIAGKTLTLTHSGTEQEFTAARQ